MLYKTLAVLLSFFSGEEGSFHVVNAPMQKINRLDKLNMFHSNFLSCLFEILCRDIRPGWSAMVRILARRISAKIFMVRLNESDKLLKVAKSALAHQKGTIAYLPYPDTSK